MPIEFLTDAQAAVYGRFAALPSRMELERFFFLDDADLRLVARRRGDHNRLGFAVQLATVRFLGTFLGDPVDVPGDVGDSVAAQLDIAASCLARYSEREKTRLEHQWEIAREYGYRDFLEVEADLARWVDDLAWTTGEGPNAIFSDAIRWLRDRRVLLPGVTVLARLVARERDAATLRVHTELAGAVTAGQARQLRRLLDVPDRARRSELDQMRKGETVTSGAGVVRALKRVSEIADLGLGTVDLSVVPHRRVVALARSKLWRIDQTADYGPLNRAARGRIDLTRIKRHWPDIQRIVASIHTGAVPAYDVLRILAPGGSPTQLGDALAHYGRIFKTLHILSYVDDEPYRREIKGMRNLQEGRHDLARTAFHGHKGELRRGYREGMEDQLGALGLVLNAITLWNTVYLDRALDELRVAGYPAMLSASRRTRAATSTSTATTSSPSRPRRHPPSTPRPRRPR